MMILSRSVGTGRRGLMPQRSPRAQARLLKEVVEGCRRLLSERGESNSVAIAEEVLDLYAGLTAEQRLAFFKVLDSEFGPHQAVLFL